MKTCIPIDRDGCRDVEASKSNVSQQFVRPLYGRGHRCQRHLPGAMSLPLQRFNASTLQRSAFTLIELLVVIAIIATLAALLLPAAGIMMRKENIGRAISERDQLETALESYKDKYGFYPPGNANPGVYTNNQLYYELMGTTASPGATVTNFTTLDGLSTISGTTVFSVFGVGAFMNCSQNTNAGAEDYVPAKQFLSNLKPGEVASNGIFGFTMIVTAANSDPPYQPIPGVNSLAGRPANPWRYMCPGSNNPTSYDLWVQIYSGGKTNLICNWSKQPIYNVPLQ
ncbi:MAG TPA: prepilin-type N-terminal cleavage/methylation domain-containing protein [Candidatus Sulfotelmatobacter sp.]|nr:prepilin-type N-terminal cleavage/methylation domain-containing protein [Candidatus Sulfotelmatobacter sp.]